MTSFIFPGQGSQYLAMAKDFNDNFKIASQTFEEIEDYTSMNIRDIIFNDNSNKLDITEFTQICIFSASYTIFKTLITENKIEIENSNIMLGHSLGEYTALACSNKINLKDCSLILKKRGKLMNNAVPPNVSGMAALIGKDANYIQKVIDRNNLNLEIANDNSQIQIVISGNLNDIKDSKELFIKNDVKKFILLNVSAAFHSKYMLDAQNELSKMIENLSFNQNNIKIISNYNAEVYNDSKLIKKNLQLQMANKVEWTKSIKKLESIGAMNLIEIGPNKVLSGLIRRISNKFDIISINKVSDIDLYDPK